MIHALFNVYIWGNVTGDDGSMRSWIHLLTGIDVREGIKYNIIM